VTDIDIEPTRWRTMDEVEQGLADRIYRAIMDASLYSLRGQQAAEFRVGISDLGYCSERTRRMLAQQIPEETDVLAAFVGTAIGDHVEAACEAAWPEALRNQTVNVTLVGDGGTYRVMGHPDLVLPWGIIDVKTDRGLAVVRRVGPSQQQQFQRHCYAKGAWEAGMFGDRPLSQVQVANVWVDRAADEKQVHVNLEPYDELVVEAATMWLDDVVYAYTNGQEARKEPPREVCAVTCGFYGDCRARDTDVSGLLTDDTVLTSVEMYREGLDLEKRGSQLKDQARAHLQGIQGSTGEYSVRWVHVNGSHVEYERGSYEKLDVRRIK